MPKSKSGGGALNAVPPTIDELTGPQKRALRRRQLGMFGPDSVVGPGTTVAALRRRGVIAGRQPHAELTDIGQRLCSQLDQEGSSNV